MHGLTERQAACLQYIKDHIGAKGYPPTLREIGAHMGIKSTNGVNDHLRALERKGALERTDTTSRGIKVLDADGDAPKGRISPMRWGPDAKMRLRTILSKYNVIATRGGKLVVDFAGELAAELGRSRVAEPDDAA